MTFGFSGQGQTCTPHDLPETPKDTPMPHVPVLTTKGLIALQALLARALADGRPTAAVLEDKIHNAAVVLLREIGPDVVTLDSRVRFRVGNGETQERTLVDGDLRQVRGMTVPLDSPRGIALLGMTIGETQTVIADGVEETITLEAVTFQPEENRRQMTGDAWPRASGANIQALRPARRPVSAGGSWDDDPGPAAA
jgi:regulator of nucleoside diphosphate kinase